MYIHIHIYFSNFFKKPTFLQHYSITNGGGAVRHSTGTPMFSFYISTMHGKFKENTGGRILGYKIKIFSSLCSEFSNCGIFCKFIFCYKLGIGPKKFRDYVNTIIDDRLKLVYTAPGGMPDMGYKENNHIYCIETTIIKNDSQMYQSEPEPCTRHLHKIINECKASLNNNHLYFISYKYYKYLKDWFDLWGKPLLEIMAFSLVNLTL